MRTPIGRDRRQDFVAISSPTNTALSANEERKIQIIEEHREIPIRESPNSKHARNQESIPLRPVLHAQVGMKIVIDVDARDIAKWSVNKEIDSKRNDNVSPEQLFAQTQ